MLQISDDIVVQLIDADKKAGIFKFISEKRFTVSDTTLTYRQINSLDEDNLLNDTRKEKKGWRKFSFKELLYLLIIAEVKKFGLKHEQLYNLREAFFGGKDSPKGYAELAIGCVFGHTQILLTIDSSGNIVFYDPQLYILHSSFGKQPQITLELNIFVNSLLKKIEHEEFIPKFTVLSEFSKGMNSDINPTEKEILNMIRDENFRTIRVEKKNGEVELAFAEKTIDTNGLTSNDVLDIIHKKDFQNIQILQRSGKIVNLKVEEAYKL